MNSVHLSDLEWLGVEMALGRYFMDRAYAAVLTELLRARGRPVPDHTILKVSRYSDQCLHTLMSELRSAMADLGFPPLPRKTKGVVDSYSIPAAAAEVILARVLRTVQDIRMVA